MQPKGLFFFFYLISRSIEFEKKNTSKRSYHGDIILNYIILLYNTYISMIILSSCDISRKKKLNVHNTCKIFSDPVDKGLTLNEHIYDAKMTHAHHAI